jgi:hypothetical protein
MWILPEKFRFQELAYPGRRDAQVTENPGCDGDTGEA